MNDVVNIERIIGNVIENCSRDETSIRRAIRMVLPSWKQTNSVEGPFNRRGYKRVAFQICNKDERYEVEWYQYDSYWDYYEAHGCVPNYYNN